MARFPPRKCRPGAPRVTRNEPLAAVTPCPDSGSAGAEKVWAPARAMAAKAAAENAAREEAAKAKATAALAAVAVLLSDDDDEELSADVAPPLRARQSR